MACQLLKIFGLILFLLIIPLQATGFDQKAITKEKKVLLTNLGGILIITGWGIANWDYFTKTPSLESEKWFSENTGEGGADKLGHLYLTYTLSHILGAQFEDWGYSHKKASLLGALSSFAMMGAMEAGDSFSNYGFSHEDFIMNAVGGIAGYFFRIHPELSRKIDLRVEYTPDFKEIDVFTDYERTRYLVAVKLEGFDTFKNQYLKYLELHLGYFARGYSDDNQEKSRKIYMGLGINISRIFNQFSWNRSATVTNYVQIPFTDLRLQKDMN